MGPRFKDADSFLKLHYRPCVGYYASSSLFYETAYFADTCLKLLEALLQITRAWRDLYYLDHAGIPGASTSHTAAGRVPIPDRFSQQSS